MPVKEVRILLALVCEGEESRDILGGSCFPVSILGLVLVPQDPIYD